MATDAAEKREPSTVVLGTVKRIITRPMTGADKAALDVPLHDLIEAGKGVKGALARAQKAVAKCKARVKAIDDQVAGIDREWREPNVDAIVEMQVVRDSQEVRIVRLDNGLVHLRRPLTKDERAGLEAKVPSLVKPAELTPEEAVLEREEARSADAAARAQLVKPYTLDDAFAEVDAEGDEDDEEEEDEPKAPKAGKGKRPGKSKRDVNKADDGPVQQEIPGAGAGPQESK